MKPCCKWIMQMGSAVICSGTPVGGHVFKAPNIKGQPSRNRKGKFRGDPFLERIGRRPSSFDS
jgi:hypothetical protein